MSSRFDDAPRRRYDFTTKHDASQVIRAETSVLTAVNRLNIPLFQAF
jgi:hypothetical protein